MNIYIKRAKKTDIGTLLKIQKRAFKPLYEIYKDNQSPFLHTEEDIFARMSTPGNDYYLIKSDDVFVGVLRIVQHRQTCYKLSSVSILPEYQNKGIAQKAIALAEALYPQAKTWFLDFPIDRPMNKKCYENLGYRDTGQRQQINERLTLAIYEKKADD